MVFEQYIEYLRDSRVSLHTTRRIAAGQQASIQPLKTTTILAYIGVLTRWLQWLKDEGELTAIIDRRGRPLTPPSLQNVLNDSLTNLSRVLRHVCPICVGSRPTMISNWLHSSTRRGC
jgi:hypothetical protein